MDKHKIEFYVGLFVIIGALCATYLFIVLGDINIIKSKQYQITGLFDSVSGLKIGARVEMAGVKIGSVSDISIDETEFIARVQLRIDKKYKLSEDSIASIKTSGIIGEKYINISPGGSDILIKAGEEMYDTESALDIESLVKQMIFNSKNTSK